MHVLFVIDTWGLIGGTERHAAVVVPALLASGHRVTVLCREDRHPGFAEVDVIEMPALEGATMARTERRELSNAIRGVHPDVIFLSALHNVDAMERLDEQAPFVRYVHDHSPFCPSLNKYRHVGERCHEPMGMVCLERYYTKGGCICFSRESYDTLVADPLRILFSKMREVELMRRAEHVLTNSRYMQGELIQVGLRPEQTSVLYYFTESNTPAQPAGPLPEETQRFLDSSDAPLVFTPARLTSPDKGIEYLLTALTKVPRPFRAVIAGSGPGEPWFRKKASQESAADSIHFAGWLPSEGIEALYAQAAVVACPSVWDEPFGLVGIESMAHGKPIVAFPVGGIPEWLSDDENGFLVERKDTDAMAQAIGRILADAGLAERLGEGGRRILAQRFPRDAHVSRLAEVLAAAAAR